MAPSSTAPGVPGLRTFSFSPAGVPCRVVVGPGALARLAPALPGIAPGRWFVVSSSPVLSAQGEALGAALRGAPGVDPDPLLVPDAEAGKSWASLGRLLDGLTRRGLRRDGGVVAFGGGSVGDVAGLAAALALRGVPVVQLPTTLLAASDSALGGKTAVNLPAGKNLAGVVHQPRLVLADTRLLDSLPERAYRSGLAEVVKCSILDGAFDRRFGALAGRLEAREPEAVAEAVTRSLRVKAAAVKADPFETLGRRALLNLGHTVGHALETASRHRLAHGEAVAWGLLAILRVSVAASGLSEALAGRLAERVRGLVRPPALGRPVLAGWPALLGSDKKGDRLGLRAVLVRRPGEAHVARVAADLLVRGLREAGAYNPAS